MPIRTTCIPAAHALPAFPFHWDGETEILTGRHEPPAGAGFTGSWELESPSGAVVILESIAGVFCGIEVVVWPDVERAPRLSPPHDPPAAAVHFVAPEAESGGVLEIEVPITAAASSDETLIHLRFGEAAKTVRVAENVLIDLDGKDALAGLWLLDVPPFPPGG